MQGLSQLKLGSHKILILFIKIDEDKSIGGRAFHPKSGDSIKKASVYIVTVPIAWLNLPLEEDLVNLLLKVI